MQLKSTEGMVTQLNIHDTTVDFKDDTYDIVIHDGDISDSGYISSNNLIAKSEHVDTLVERFSNRKGNVDKYDGFTGFMLIKSDNKFSVLTGWKSSDDFNAWVNSEAFQNSHVKKEERVKEQGSEFLEEMAVRESYSVEV